MPLVNIVFIHEECTVPVPESKNLYHVVHVAIFQVTSNYLSDVNLVKETSNTGRFSFWVLPTCNVCHLKI